MSTDKTAPAAQWTTPPRRLQVAILRGTIVQTADGGYGATSELGATPAGYVVGIDDDGFVLVDTEVSAGLAVVILAGGDDVIAYGGT